MSLYILIPLAAFVLSACAATAILARDPRDRTNRVAAVFVAQATVWSFCELLWGATDDPAVALGLIRASAVGWVWLGPLSLELFLLITGEPGPRVRRVLPFLHAGSFGFLVVAWLTPWIHARAVRTPFGWSYEFGPVYPVYYATALACIAVALNIGVRAYQRASSPGERAQARWLGAGMAVPLVVASLTDGLLPLAGVHPPHLGTISFALFGVTVAWLIYRFGYFLLAPSTFAGAILETLPDGVAMLRHDARIRTANGALARIMECRPEKLLGLRLRERLSEFPRDPIEGVVEWECDLETHAGAKIPVSVAASVLRERHGYPIGHVLVVRDLREVASLRQRLALSGRLAAVGELAAGIAHEINNPLAFVRANLSLLRSHWESLGSEALKGELSDHGAELLAEGEELLDESLVGVDRAAAIVRDVRGLSHAGGGARQTADVQALLDGVLRMSAPQLRGPIEVETDYADVPTLVCSAPEIQQVFMNLVLNAAQSIQGSGTVRVRTRLDEDHVVVEVEDDGVGIPPEVAMRIFDPFFTTKPVGEGTGLGLGIAYEIVRRHRGTIEVDSEPGRGSRFRVRLPCGVDTLETAGAAAS